jgi:hypothetical protein
MTFFTGRLQVFAMVNDKGGLNWDEKLWFSDIEFSDIEFSHAGA